jgi:hypothetical protein
LNLYFSKLTQPLTVSVKEKGGKTERKPYPLPYGLRNPYRNLKSENSQDFAQKNCTFMNSASGKVSLGMHSSEYCLQYMVVLIDEIQCTNWTAQQIFDWRAELLNKETHILKTEACRYNADQLLWLSQVNCLSLLNLWASQLTQSLICS